MQEIQCVTFNAKQAAKYVGVSYWTMLNLARQGLITHFRCGNKILFRKTMLDEWMEESENCNYVLDDGLPVYTRNDRISRSQVL